MKILSSKDVVAKKKHLCELCLSEIKIGEKYHKTVCVDGGDLFDNKTHQECEDVISYIQADSFGLDDECTYNEIYHTIQEFAHDRWGIESWNTDKYPKRKDLIHEVWLRINSINE